MNPNFLFLYCETWLSLSCVVSVSSSIILPLVGLSRSPIMLSNVDFPEPELPIIKTNSPRFIVNDTLSSA